MPQIQTFRYSAEFAKDCMDSLPYGYIDKTVCGCGLSSVALENSEDTILAVPNVNLVLNKVAQYPNSRSPLEVFGVYSGVSKEAISDYLDRAKVVKIIVTYDSLWKVERLLSGGCRLIVDESNRLLSYKKLKSSGKASSGKDVLRYLFSICERHKDRVSFVSATPIPLEYMPKWISEIPQIRMEWENTSKARPILMQRTYPYKALSEEIIYPIMEVGHVSLEGGMKIRKAIIFVNSVSAIAKSLKDLKVSPDDVRFIVGDTVKNDVALKGYSRLESPDRLPKFTFVTGTGFDGIDLHDSEAISIVVGNTDRNYHLVDISTDLLQAISRQRDKSNVHYGRYVFIYNQTVFSQTEEELLLKLEEKHDSLVSAINIWESVRGTPDERGFVYTKTNPDFLYYTEYDEDSDSYSIDEDVFQADKYFILETRKSFERGFDIKGALHGEESGIVESPLGVPRPSKYSEVAEYFKDHYVKGKPFSWGPHANSVDYIRLVETAYKMYGKVYTNYTVARQMVENYLNPKGRMRAKVHGAFSLRKRYSRKQIKDILSSIYRSEGISRIVKYSDITEFFRVVEVKIKGERILEIVSRIK